jgi:hypothetical protein
MRRRQGVLSMSCYGARPNYIEKECYMSQDDNTLLVYAHNGDMIGSITIHSAIGGGSVFGVRGEVRRFSICEGRRQLLAAWDRWSQLILRSPQNETLQVVITIVAFPTGRDGEGYLRFL